METTRTASFGAQLKRYRLAAGLSQEELAERARLSVRAIGAYEGGDRQAPYRDTVQLLAQALSLSPEEAAALESAVPRRRGPSAQSPEPVEAPAEHPPAFGALVRRYRELAALSQAALAERAGLSTDAISVIERGKRGAPRLETVAMLAGALGLGEEERAAFVAAARVLDPAEGAVFGSPQLPAGPSSSTGRERAATSPADLPTGTLTFLLTDVVGSTTLWERHPAAMRDALARHDALIEEVLARHGGRQVKERGEGDSVFAVFANPSAALTAACALQRALLAEPWPADTPLRVRAGLHSGEADPRAGSYYGLAVNRTARIRSLAHGGQILLSQGTYELVRDGLPEGVELRPLGEHVLKGLQRPEELYQVLAPGLPSDFPPLSSRQANPTNLPAALSSFIGREREQGEVRELLGSSRLVTLTGVGGMGKTRLALEVAGGLLAEYPDGVWLAELAPLADPGLLPEAVAAVLGVQEVADRSVLQILTEHLRGRRLLLVLDNCEHLVAACADLAARLLRACPHLRILATSREALGITGEVAWPVPPLTLPDVPAAGRRLPLDELLDCEAVQLLLARVRERRPDFALSEQNAAAVAGVVRRLDGLPLAIELAAARLVVLSPGQLAARLDDRFRLLTAGSRAALPRHQTLRAALDWSYDLLTDAERALLRRLAVFVGGATLEAAEAVCTDEGVAAEGVLDVLGGLVSRSLVQVREQEGVARYWLLETVRAYARERLEGSGEAAAIARTHARLYLALAEEAEPKLLGPEQGIWLDRLGAEHDDLRAALRWAVATGEGEAGLRLAGALWQFWATRGHLREGQGWLSALLALDAAGVPAAVRARALSVAGCLAQMQSDYPRAWAWHEEALALRRALGDRKGISKSLTNLGNVAERRGEYGRAAALLEESLALFRDLGDTQGIAYSLTNLGNVAERRGEYGRAAALLEESLALFRELGDSWGIANALTDLGSVECRRGEYGRAAALLDESLSLSRDIGARDVVALGLGDLAAVVVALGQPMRGARLGGAAEALREALGLPLAPARSDQDQAVGVMRATMGEEAFAAAWAEGRAMPLEEAVALALDTQGSGAEAPIREGLPGCEADVVDRQRVQ